MVGGEEPIRTVRPQQKGRAPSSPSAQLGSFFWVKQERFNGGGQ
jgi:hypothetical protein